MLKKLGLLVVVMVVLYAIFHRSDSTPSSISAPRDTSSTFAEPAAPGKTPSNFAGYNCVGDCSGHQAGYDWAEEKGLSDEDDCDAAGDRSNSPSFAEGCKAFVNGNSPTNKEDDDDKDDDDQSAILTAIKAISA